MNDIFYAFISGFNVVAGVLMIAAIVYGPAKEWNRLLKFGFFLMALGLLGQAAYVLSGAQLSDPIWDQLWSLKDIGMWIFTIPVIGQWIDKSHERDL